MHPPTMYFPLIVHEALMFEPTETEGKETLDAAVDAVKKILQRAKTEPEKLHLSPVTTPIGRPDEVAPRATPSYDMNLRRQQNDGTKLQIAF